MSSPAHAPTASEYIVHHLTHLRNHEQKAVADFSVVNFDSLFFAAPLVFFYLKIVVFQVP